MKRKTLWLKSGFMFLGICLMLVVSTNTYAKEKFVTVLCQGDYTGPGAGLAGPAMTGFEDAVKDINEQGGVRGVRINFIAVDTRYDVSRYISSYKKYRRSPNLVQVTMTNTGATRAIISLMTRDKVVCNPTPDGLLVANPGWSFLWGPCYQDGFGAALDWIVNDWKSKGKKGKPKVGYIAWDNPYGRSPFDGGLEYAKTLPIDLLPFEFFPPGALNHDVWLNRLSEGGANYIYIVAVDPSPSNVIRDAYKLGMTKNIQFITDFWGPNQAIGVRQHPTELEGTVTTSFYQKGPEAQQNPYAKRIFEKYQKKPASDLSGIWLVGYGIAKFLEGALAKALDKFGYEKMNGEALYWGYTHITGLEREGMAGACTYTKTERRGSRGVKFYQVKSGNLVPITDWLLAPDCVRMHKWD